MPRAACRLSTSVSILVGLKTGLPSGLSLLLGKLGLNLGGTEKAEKGLTGGPKEKGVDVEKGMPLGDGAVLAGLGHTPHDRRVPNRNVAEKQNIDRFMQDPHAEDA